jgi:hypothetical protein
MFSELDDTITMNEIQNAYRELNTGKSPGADYMLNEVFKCDNVKVNEYLYVLFNK